jgi:archaeal flagellar protein FlaJ
MNSFERVSWKLLGRRAQNKRNKYAELRNALMAARFKVSSEVYIATAYLASLLAGIIAAVIFGIVTYIFNLPDLVTYPGEASSSLGGLTHYSLVLGTIAAVIISFIVFAGVTFVIVNIYPSIIAGNRKRNIDATLPYAINYITAMSTAGIPPAEIFRQLGQSPMYGESSVEARYITLEIDLFGRDLIDALRIISSTTPSQRMKEFLQGTMGCVSSGSNLTEYFRTKADQYALENRQSQRMFLETLGLISESYVTAMVAGPLFLIILQSIMSILSNETQPMFLYAIIYILIPLGSIAFVVMISAMTPEG